MIDKLKIPENFLLAALVGMGLLHILLASPGLDPAMATDRYGIQGRQAPELNLTDWIGGDGKPMNPVRLADLRGKVIYLYFFQDW